MVVKGMRDWLRTHIFTPHAWENQTDERNGCHSNSHTPRSVVSPTPLMLGCAGKVCVCVCTCVCVCARVCVCVCAHRDGTWDGCSHSLYPSINMCAYTHTHTHTHTHMYTHAHTHAHTHTHTCTHTQHTSQSIGTVHGLRSYTPVLTPTIQIHASTHLSPIIPSSNFFYFFLIKNAYNEGMRFQSV